MDGLRLAGRAAAVIGIAAAVLCIAVVAQEPERSIEDEVVADVLSQRCGYGTLADLDYPVEYVRRYADRIIRASFERRFRAVIRNPDETPEVEGPPAPPGIRSSSRPASRPVLPDFVRFIESAVPASTRPPEKPEATTIGFRARPDVPPGGPIFGGHAATRMSVYDKDEAWDRAADHVARNLARDGVLKTLVTTVEMVGSDEFLGVPTRGPSPATERLAQIGLPVDLLRHFRSPTDGAPPAVVEIARRLQSTPRDKLVEELAAYQFEYSATVEGFRSIRDDGGDEIGGLRLQMSRGGDWIGPGDGGAIDIGRQLAAALPATPIFVSVQRPDLDEFTIMLGDWVKARRGPIVVAAEPLEISQWAQDNARNGVVVAGSRKGEVVTLAPRYASRGEMGALFAHGDTYLLDTFAAAGHDCAQSSLLFQGGDMLFICDPAKKEYVVVMGEAEVHRNRGLGLTREQVLAAYQAEFGADRCVVLPTLSFHIDYEISFRAVDGRMVAFVNDPLATARIIARASIDTLIRLEVLDATAAAAARGHLDSGRDVEFVNLLGGALIGRAIGAGVYAESFAEKFTSGASGESGVANFQSILLALDILLNLSLPEDQVPMDRPGGYIRAWRRYAADLATLRKTLEDEGWKVVAVPSISNGERSVNYLNGIHTPKRYYMPAIGGLLHSVDEAAAAAFKAEFGPGVEIVPVFTGETQRRLGALRCAVSVLPENAQRSRP